MANVTVRTRAQLARLKPGEHRSIHLAQEGREGLFKWVGSNLAPFAALDPDQAVYVTPATIQSGASGAWVRQVEDGRLNVQWGGAVADSSGFDGAMGNRKHRTDNGPVIERMLALASALELTCYIPAVEDSDRFYSSRTTIFLPRKVDIEVDGKLVNGFRAERNQNAMLFQPGNFHPAFTNRKTLSVHGCGRPQIGERSIKLENAFNALKYAVGDQIGIVSDTSSSVAGYYSSRYHHLATVTRIAGGTIEFDRPLSFGGMLSAIYNASRTPARTVNGRRRNLFYWTGRVYGTGHLESERHSLWSDSAMVDCDIGQGLTTHARRSVAYGNLCQNTRFHGFHSKCSQSFTELSQQSVGSVIENFTAEYAPTLSKEGLVTMEANLGGDHARDCIMRNGRISARGAPPTGRPMIHIGLAQNCHVHDIELEFDERGTNAELLSISSSLNPAPDFPFTNNVISRIRATGKSSGYFVSLNGNNQPLFTDNRIVSVTINAKLTGSNGYAAYIANCPGGGNALRDIDFGGQGRLRIANSSGRQIAINLRNMGGPPIHGAIARLSNPLGQHEIWGVEWGQ